MPWQRIPTRWRAQASLSQASSTCISAGTSSRSTRRRWHACPGSPPSCGEVRSQRRARELGRSDAGCWLALTHLRTPHRAGQHGRGLLQVQDVHDCLNPQCASSQAAAARRHKRSCFREVPRGGLTLTSPSPPPPRPWPHPDDTIQPGNCKTAVSKLGDYLVENGV
eukprot:scaffold11278_cov145-Isochrysis_galbana.AAC.9